MASHTQLIADFQAIVGGPKADNYAALLRIFKRKVRRSKNGADRNGHGTISTTLQVYLSLRTGGSKLIPTHVPFHLIQAQSVVRAR